MDLCNGDIYEMQRNAKLIAMGREDEITDYFQPGKSGNDIFTEMVVDKMKEQHEYAGMVYDFLTRHGYSDIAIAGILGNMMNECGGNTLTLHPFIYDQNGKHYGLCQWNIYYNKTVNGSGVDDQLLYLHETIEKVMKQFGGSFDAFNSLESAEYAGVYFCKYYERGINAKQRGLNSIRALEWIKEFK